MVTTNFPDGITNTLNSTVFGAYGDTDPSKYYSFFEDFNRFSGAATGVADWLTTITGTGTAIVNDEGGGVLLITNSAAATDAFFAQWEGGNAANVAETFAIVPGKQAWFKTRFQVNDATASAFAIGLQITDTTPLSATDGVWFAKAAGSTQITLNASKASVASVGNVAALANATYITLGFYYDGASALVGFVNDLAAVTLPVTNLPAHTLAVSFGIQNGAAAAKSMNLDYIFASIER